MFIAWVDLLLSLDTTVLQLKLIKTVQISAMDIMTVAETLGPLQQRQLNLQLTNDRLNIIGT